MAAIITATRTTTLFNDVDGDGVAETGDTLRHVVRIANTGDATATNIVLNDTLAGTTLVAGSIMITPVAADDSFTITGNAPVTYTFAQLTGNDLDQDGSPAQLIVTAVGGATNGTVTIDTVAQTVTFTPTTGLAVGMTPSFTYTVQDTQGLASVTTGTVSMAVADRAWFVDSSYAGGNGAADGSYLRPFTTLGSLNGAANNGATIGDVDDINDTIFVYNRGSAYTGGLTLEAGQKLYGDGTAFSVNGTAINGQAGQTNIADSGTYGVRLASGNTLSGFDLTGGATTAIVDNGASVGTLNISNVAVSGGGAILSIANGGILNVSLNSAASTSSTVGAIVLGGGSSGSFGVTGATAVTGATGVGISSTGSVASTFAGTVNIVTTTGNAINLAGGSSATLSGTTKHIETGTGVAVASSNGSFTSTNGGLEIVATGTGGQGLIASTGGSVAISGATNTIATTTGTALSLTNTTSGGITLQSVGKSAQSGNTAVVLNTAGISGVAITGTGTTAGSGGTIVGGASAFDIANTSNISLSNVNVSGSFTNSGINGTGVNNFTLRDSTFAGTYGDAAGEGTISFGTVGSATNGVTGTVLLEGNNLSGVAYSSAIQVYNNAAGTLNLTIQDSATKQAVVGSNNTTTGVDGIHVETSSTAIVTATVNGVEVVGARDDLIEFVARGSSTQTLTVTNNDLTGAQATSGGNTIAIDAQAPNAGNSPTVTYAIGNNTLTGAGGAAIFVDASGIAGTVRGTITNNTIGTAGGGSTGVGSTSGDGILIQNISSGGGTLTNTTTISGNTIRDIALGTGIFLRADGGASVGQSRIEATVSNNTIAEMGVNSLAGIYAQVGNFNSSTARLGLNLTNNTINLSGATNALDAVFFDQTTTTAGFYLPGYAGPPSGNIDAAVAAFLTSKPNTLTSGGSPFGTNGVHVESASGFVGTAFTQPVPLLAVQPAPSDDATDPNTPVPTVPPVDPNEPTPVATSPTAPAPVATDSGLVTQAQLDTLVAAAITRWIAVGASEEQVAAMHATQITLSDMSGIYLGSSTGGAISIDVDGAGYGWFVDTTPGDDAEFSGSGTRLTGEGAAASRIDLLTVLLHELGHQAGLDDTYLLSDRDDLMYGYINVGERRVPAWGESYGATPGEGGHTDFALAPVTVGGLPAGKSVDVIWRSTVDAQTSKVITNVTGQATVSGTGFTTVTSNINTTALDTLTIGNLVFSDVNRNGVFDAGDTGIVGVAMSLFADADNNGVADGAAILTTSTGAGGIYAFAGLAPGTYIVSINAANFGAGQLLQNRTSFAGGTDPDDNIDNDDNGVAGTGSTIVAAPITIAYNSEPTAGAGNDVNTTVDFGFLVANTAPSLTNVGTPVAYTEQGAAIFIDSAVTFVDAEGNFNGGTLVVSGVLADDVIGIFNQGNGAGQIGVSGATLSYGGVAIGTIAGGNGASLTVTFNASATSVAVDAAIQQLSYANTSDTPTASHVVSITVVDDQSASTGAVNVTINITAVDDAPVAVADNAGNLFANATKTFAVTTNDTDVDGGPKAVATIAGAAAVVGTPITLSSGATVTLEANGTLTYNPNGAYNGLVSVATGGATGAQNTSATDSFVYTLNGGSQATVTVTVDGVDGPGDRLLGSSGDNSITGLGGDDYIDASQGGADAVNGGAGNDGLYFGAAFAAGDVANGGAGTNDQLGLQGNYAAGVTLTGTNVIGVEVVAVMPGAGFSYDLTTTNDLIAPGANMVVYASQLGAGQNFTLRGGAELDGNFVVFGGQGTDLITTGAGNDSIYFGPGRYNPATDVVDGGAGTNDLFGLDGDYVVTLTGASIVNIEVISLLRGLTGDLSDYNITLADSLIAPGGAMTISAASVETPLVVDGTAETSGSIRIFGGIGADTLTGGGGADWIWGNRGNDTLRGNGGADRFHFELPPIAGDIDTIADFSTAQGDKIELVGSVFGVDGATFASAFVVGTAALDGDDRILYNAATGQLFFDADGNGAGAAVQFATLTGNPVLVASDFVIV